MEHDHGQEGTHLSSPAHHPGPDWAPSVLRVPHSRAGLRADVFLSRELPSLSRTRIRQKIQMGESLLNGRRYSTATRVRAGDEISMSWRGVPEQGPVVDLEILYEDSLLLAVNKPAGMASHPVGKRQAGTVVQLARARHAEQIRESLERGDMSFYPTLVNRLDVFTSGVIILALTGPMHKLMQSLVGQRRVTREYVALVEGTVRDEEGSIELPIGPDTASRVRLKMACRSGGKESVTTYTVIERLPGHTVLRVMPLTGRQHQIRVHLAAIGHPVVGDLLYKDEALFLASHSRTEVVEVSTLPAGPLPDSPVSAGPLPPRHFLHARQARFDHPVTSAEITIEAPLPADFEAILSRLRASDP
jgi:23S rRNA pseudouridine1911/1915/1917 synthase